MSDLNLNTAARVFPLTRDEQTRAEQIARRLRGELRSLVATFPPNARTSSGMSRAFGVNRTVCHRLLTALQSGGGDLEFLTHLPGVKGLRLCVSHAREGTTSAREPVFASADSAVDAFAGLIDSLAGSHARLTGRIRATREAAGRPSAAPDRSMPSRARRAELRRRIHDAVAELTGKTTNVRVSISLMRPVPDDPESVEYAHVRAYIGHRARPGALPLLLGTDLSHTDDEARPDNGPEFVALDGSKLTGRSRAAVVREFSGDPVPIVTTRDKPGHFTQVIDNTSQTDGVCPDLVLAYRIPRVSAHPARQNPPVYCESLGLWEPARELLMDVYLHSSMTAGCKPSMTAFLGHREVECDITDRWHDRIEGSPVLTLLGPGIHNAASDAYPRHADLMLHVFNTLGWDPDDFVGYRCAEAYPQWGCDYVMAFDYRDEVED